jgi:hypothetical protein
LDDLVVEYWPCLDREERQRLTEARDVASEFVRIALDAEERGPDGFVVDVAVSQAVDAYLSELRELRVARVRRGTRHAK